MALTTAAPQQVAQQATLKFITISGTGLSWTLGEQHDYLVQDGKDVAKKVGLIVGMGIVTAPPNQFGQVEKQVQIVYEDGYRDVFVCADHLVVTNLHVSPVAVVQGPKLVVPK